MTRLAVITGPFYLAMTYYTRIARHGFRLDRRLYQEFGRPPKVVVVLHMYDLLLVPGIQTEQQLHTVGTRANQPAVDIQRKDLSELLRFGRFESKLDWLLDHRIYRVMDCLAHNHPQYTRI